VAGGDLDTGGKGGGNYGGELQNARRIIPYTMQPRKKTPPKKKKGQPQTKVNRPSPWGLHLWGEAKRRGGEADSLTEVDIPNTVGVFSMGSRGGKWGLKD